MSESRRSAARAACVLAAIAASSGALAAPPLYRVTDLGLPDGVTSATVVALDDDGRVGGFLERLYPSFIWSKAHGYQAAPYESGQTGPVLRALDGNGGAVGYQQGAGFYSSPSGRVTLLASLGQGGCGAYGVNDLDTAIGNCAALDSFGNLAQHAVTWSRKGVVDRHPAGYTQSYGIAINHAGQMLVSAKAGLASRNVVIQPGGRSVLLSNEPYGSNTFATAINAAGTVAGLVDGFDAQHAPPVIWRAGQAPLVLTTGSAFDGQNGTARSLDDAETVVGDISSGAFVWTATDGMRLLADAIDPADPLYGRVVFDVTSVRINNRGQIAISGSVGHELHPLLLTPEK